MPWTPEAVVAAIRQGDRSPAVRSAAKRTHGTWVAACEAAQVYPPDEVRTREQAEEIEPRVCEWCGEQYWRGRDEDGHLERSDRWQQRKYCGRTCANRAKRG